MALRGVAGKCVHEGRVRSIVTRGQVGLTYCVYVRVCVGVHDLLDPVHRVYHPDHCHSLHHNRTHILPASGRGLEVR